MHVVDGEFLDEARTRAMIDKASMSGFTVMGENWIMSDNGIDEDELTATIEAQRLLGQGDVVARDDQLMY